MPRPVENNLLSTVLPPPRFLDYPFLTALELASVLLLILILQWRECAWLPISISQWLLSARPGLLGALTASIVIFSFIRLRETRHTLGLLPSDWTTGWATLTVYTLVSLVILIALGLTVGHPMLDLRWLLNYAGGMLLQQIALQCFLNNRLYRIAPNHSEPARTRFAVVASTTLFALLHAPNPWLLLGTIPAGAFWTWHFRRRHNLPALLASHLVLGSAAMMLLGKGPLLRLRVGWPAMETILGQRPI